ncbi:hypothetical protein [Amycolatopsis sp. NPDC052450]|uniref:hypothetical protein n=1 Tax=Amycolatopsis sp. NPDC052450 TaxID=3363937 RepID=UPI0037C8C548
MNIVSLALIESIRWVSLRTASGDGRNLPQVFRSLASATSLAEAESAYWNIDNEVIVQGEIYEAAEAALEIALSMSSTVPPGPVRKCLAELIQQIVFSQPHSSEVKEGNREIIARCLSLAAEATWVFYGWLSDLDQDVRECALLTLHRVENNDARKSTVFARYRECDKSRGVQKIFLQIDKGVL